ncbi:oxidative damage protection protein [Marinicella rhabdoformis]|uniref:oxidative damage protection protein n=1 Tax=Marinicella rhabdoformis TaxID=2580566 RepID=UPI0012AEC29C|nr:oxidative damage protection protein [Marinicella rhabdoformis]
MTTITCLKYGADQAPIPYPAYPGELGERIMANVSMKFWQEWLAQQTMIINENHFSPIDPEHRKIIEEKMIKFLFEGQDVTPQGFAPEDE